MCNRACWRGVVYVNQGSLGQGEGVECAIERAGEESYTLTKGQVEGVECAYLHCNRKQHQPSRSREYQLVPAVTMNVYIRKERGRVSINMSQAAKANGNERELVANTRKKSHTKV